MTDHYKVLRFILLLQESEKGAAARSSPLPAKTLLPKRKEAEPNEKTQT